MNIVYGNNDIFHICNVLLPALSKASSLDMRINLLNYQEKLISIEMLSHFGNMTYNLLEQNNFNLGFAANHNYIARRVSPSEDFVLLNPDCIPTPNSITKMLALKHSQRRVAIVEARQWPYEHPKFYDSMTFETPWASFAFAILDFNIFLHLGGLCEDFFMYMEDVDYSWRCRLESFSVLYCRDAVGLHFSSGIVSQFNTPSLQEWIGPRNFLLLANRFFDTDSVHRAEQFLLLHRGEDELSRAQMRLDKEGVLNSKVSRLKLNSHPWINIYGYNQFHKMRKS